MNGTDSPRLMVPSPKSGHTNLVSTHGIFRNLYPDIYSLATPLFGDRECLIWPCVVTKDVRGRITSDKREEALRAS